jgi:hypothetical protein
VSRVAPDAANPLHRGHRSCIERGCDQKLILLATSLLSDEPWTLLKPGLLHAFMQGEKVLQDPTRRRLDDSSQNAVFSNLAFSGFGQVRRYGRGCGRGRGRRCAARRGDPDVFANGWFREVCIEKNKG